MDTQIPDRWGPALRAAIWGAAPFIFFMAAVIEGVIAGNYLVAVVCGVLFFASIALVIYWDKLVPLRFRAELRLSLQYLSARDSQLGPAIISMARQSAYGRWYAAQHLVNSGSPVGLQHLYQVAAGEVMQKITDGDLEVRGRRPDPDQLGLEPIDRTYWLSCSLCCVKDPIALWKIILIPKGGVEFDQNGNTVRADNAVAARRTSLLDYDLLLVDAYQFEGLWPQKEKVADHERRKFLREAARRGLDKDEIQRLSDPPTTGWIGILCLIIIGLIILASYLLYLGKWHWSFDWKTTATPGPSAGDKPSQQTPPQSAPAVTNAPTPMPQPSPSLNEQEIATKIVVWKSIELKMDDLGPIINYGYNMLATWERDFRSNPSGEIEIVGKLTNSIADFRAKLARLRDNYSNYPDIADALKEIAISGGRPPVPGTIFDRLIRSSEAFAQELRSPPQNFEAEMTTYVGALKRDLDAIRDWRNKITQTAIDQAKELAKMEAK